MPRVTAHEVIERHLRDLLRSLGPGRQFPSDRELSEQFQVSRMTARQAVSTLVAEGRVYRVAGSGTYVAEHPVHRRINRLLSFSEHMRRNGLMPSAQVLVSGVRPGTPEENTDLGQPMRSDVCQLRRVLCGDGVPIAVEEAVLRIECRPVLEADLVNDSLYAALTELGHEPSHAMGTLSAESAGDELARLLDAPVGAALMVQRQVINDQDQVPIQLTVSRYVGDRFVFDMDQYKHVYTDAHERQREPSYELRSIKERRRDGSSAPQG